MIIIDWKWNFQKNFCKNILDVRPLQLFLVSVIDVYSSIRFKYQLEIEFFKSSNIHFKELSKKIFNFFPIYSTFLEF
jgi:hypothetical protein